ncbi:MAG: NAD+ synthase, partial [Thermodesulfobacteria bacterium]|nr:NAD+ synthase [Thermodesulfobacteriota bacterium]
VLDPILELYLEQKLSPRQIVERGYDEEIVRKIVQMVDRNEYKRLQAPLGPKVTVKAFCCGRRYPVAHGYRPI